ncbi:MAG: DUF2837 family protein [Eubacteriales bacterium]
MKIDRLLLIFILTAIIHLTDTLAYAVRLSGVSTKRLATAFSLFQIVSLLSSTANLVQAPLLSSIVEQTINNAMKDTLTVSQGLAQDPCYRQQLTVLSYQIRLVIFSATAGTLVGVFFTPIFTFIFNRVIYMFEEAGSVTRLVLMLLSPRRLILLLFHSFSFLPKPRLYRRTIPLAFLIANVIVIAVWTTGVLSSLYAGALLPDYRSTASLLSGVVNGIATILSAIIVNPTAAVITDHALGGGRNEEVKQMVYYLCLTRVLGTLLAQTIFIPSALLVKWVATLIVGL